MEDLNLEAHEKLIMCKSDPKNKASVNLYYMNKKTLSPGRNETYFLILILLP